MYHGTIAFGTDYDVKGRPVRKLLRTIEVKVLGNMD
jgi:hypothetical protein